MPPPFAVRVKTATGWQDIAIQGATGEKGDPGVLAVYEQPSQPPANTPVGTVWVDTDATPTVPANMDTLPIGALQYLDEWDWQTAYSKGAVVSYDGGIYVAPADVVAGSYPDDDPSEWLLLSDGRSDSWRWAGWFDGDNEYFVGDVVGQSGDLSISVALTENPITVPHKDYVGDDWLVIERVASAGSSPQFVSTLPVSPVDGQVVYYQNAAMATDGVTWTLRYRAAGGTYKWEFVGGGTWEKEVDADEPMTSTTYADAATVGPQITVPLVGEYVLEYGMWPGTGNISGVAYCSPRIGATAATDTDAVGVSVGDATGAGSAVSRQRRKTITAAATLVKLQYRRQGTALVTVYFPLSQHHASEGRLMSVTRVKTSAGWVDITTVGPQGETGPAGGGVHIGTSPPDPALKQLWVDTDEPTLVNTIATVTALPSSPVNGQEVYFQSATMATAGLAWHLRYNSASASAYKWECVGGPPLRTKIATQETGPGGPDLATIGPRLYAQLAGEYIFSWGCTFVVSGGGPSKISAYMAFGAGLTVPSPGFPAEYLMTYPAFIHNFNVRSVGELVRTVALNEECRVRYAQQANAAATVSTSERWLAMVPIRVG